MEKMVLGSGSGKYYVQILGLRHLVGKVEFYSNGAENMTFGQANF